MANISSKTGLIALILGAVGFAAYKFAPAIKKLLKAKKVGDNISLNISTLSLKKPFGIVFRAVNPTNGELTIDSIGGDILANEESIATFVKTDKIFIAPNSETKFNLPLKINPIQFLSIVADIVGFKGDKKKIGDYIKKLKLKAVGSANADGIIIKINTKIYN